MKVQSLNVNTKELKREVQNWLRVLSNLERLANLLDEAKRALEASDPPKGGYTRNLISRIKRGLMAKRAIKL